MIVDTSALFAIEFLEPEAARLDQALRSTPQTQISAASAVELMVALSRRRHAEQTQAVQDLLAVYRIVIAPVDAGQTRQAWQAFALFGQGSGHPAQLNFGDCFSYALATSTGLPLLFKGEDFSRTDVAVAPY